MRRTVIGAILVGAVAGVGLLPGAARAATALIPRSTEEQLALPEQGGGIWYNADPGERNELIVTSDGSGTFRFEDAGAVITAGTGCTAVSLHEVTCDVPAVELDKGLMVYTHDRNDSIDVTGVALTDVPGSGPTLDAGEGNDLVLGGNAGEGLRGGFGDDVVRGNGRGDGLSGGPGDDVLVGGPGNDWFDGDSLGADVLDGGAGDGDIAEYTYSPGSVVVTLDNRPGDGVAGENDNVRRTVEVVYGSMYPDRIVGNGRANDLLGNHGRDVLVGRGGDDFLWGGFHADILRPGSGRDGVDGYRGDDTIYARDGARDRLHGGEGRDRARIDRGLDARKSIEGLF